MQLSKNTCELAIIKSLGNAELMNDIDLLESTQGFHFKLGIWRIIKSLSMPFDL